MSALKSQDELWYEVDRHNTIIGLSPNWDKQALDQDFPALLSQHLLGNALSRFISGDATTMFTETMLEAARVKQEEINRPYRCDTPELKREMMMRIIPLEDKGLRVSHYTLKTEAWQRTSVFKVQANPPNIVQKSCRSTLIKRCSLCNNLRDAKNKEKWITQEEFLQHYPEWIEQSIPVFYGICPNCQLK